MDREITILVVGSDNEMEYRDVALKPGTRASDILMQLKLQGYALRKPDGSGKFFAANEDVFAAVEKEGVFKLEAVPGMPVAIAGPGASRPAPVPGLFSRIIRRRPPTIVSPARTVISPSVPTAVIRRPRPLWVERGWRQIDHRKWSGKYELPQGKWDGEVTKEGANVYRPWISDPPRAVSAHHHRACLGNAGRAYRLHFSTNPVSVDGAVLAMENFLAESFARAGGRS